MWGAGVGGGGHGPHCPGSEQGAPEGAGWAVGCGAKEPLCTAWRVRSLGHGGGARPKAQAAVHSLTQLFQEEGGGPAGVLLPARLLGEKTGLQVGEGEGPPQGHPSVASPRGPWEGRCGILRWGGLPLRLGSGLQGQRAWRLPFKDQEWLPSVRGVCLP